MLTTHYMEEAERLCDRVAIVDHGRVIAEGPPHRLIASLGADHVVDFALGEGRAVEDAALLALPGVTGVSLADGRTRLTVTRAHEAMPALMTLLRERGAALTELTSHRTTLEDVFISLTGRHLRDE